MDEHSITNVTTRTGEEEVTKFFPCFRWNIITINLVKLVLLDFKVLGVFDGVEREIEAKEELNKIGVKTPSIISREGRTVKMSYLPGDNLRKVLLKSSESFCEDIGRKKGEQIKKFHLNGLALVDSRLSNSILGEDGKIASVDHELFTKNPSNLDRQIDIISLKASAMFLPYEKSASFLQGFDKAYTVSKNLKFLRKILLLFSGPWLAVFGEKSFKSLRNFFKNWFKDF